MLSCCPQGKNQTAYHGLPWLAWSSSSLPLLSHSPSLHHVLATGFCPSLEQASCVPIIGPLHLLNFYLECFSFPVVLWMTSCYAGLKHYPFLRKVFSLPQPAPLYHFTLFCLLYSTYRLQKLYCIIYLNAQCYSFPPESNSLKTGTLIYLVHCYVPIA